MNPSAVERSSQEKFSRVGLSCVSSTGIWQQMFFKINWLALCHGLVDQNIGFELYTVFNREPVQTLECMCNTGMARGACDDAAEGILDFL